MTHVAYESKLRSVVRSSLHPCQNTGWQLGVRSCSMPKHLVQELIVGTVWEISK